MIAGKIQKKYDELASVQAEAAEREAEAQKAN